MSQDYNVKRIIPFGTTKSADLPAPIVPAETDLTTFPFMQVPIDRLLSSREWSLSRRNPARAFYLMNLWMAAFHAKPAGSLEDDDITLADIARCDDGQWASIKAEVMQNWIKCSDGRLYHPFLADIVIDASAKRQANIDKTANARKAKKSQADSLSQSSDSSVTALKEKRLKRNKENQSESESNTNVRSPDADADEPAWDSDSAGKFFDEKLWPSRPSRGKCDNPKKPAKAKFIKLVVNDGWHPEHILRGIKRYASANPDPRFTPMLITFLNQERFDDPSPGGGP
jgi:hypothetical protein